MLGNFAKTRRHSVRAVKRLAAFGGRAYAAPVRVAGLDDDGEPLLGLTAAAWLARVSEQTLRNWLVKEPGLKRRLDGRDVVRLPDLDGLLRRRTARGALDPACLDLPAGRLAGAAHGGASRKAEQASAAAELEDAWTRERRLARERDYWRVTAEGYQQALAALVTKDQRLHPAPVDAQPGEPPLHG